jgi:hypothetical protein
MSGTVYALAAAGGELAQSEADMNNALEAEKRIVAMSDGQLIDAVVDHPAEYEPWALEIAQKELARRGLARDYVEQLREENVATAAASRPAPIVLKLLAWWLLSPLLIPLALLTCPVLGWVATKFERNEDLWIASRLRFLAKVGVILWCATLLAFCALLVERLVR